MATQDKLTEDFANREYEHGFVTDVEQDTLPPGLDESVVRFISAKKEEPEWLLEQDENPFVPVLDGHCYSRRSEQDRAAQNEGRGRVVEATLDKQEERPCESQQSHEENRYRDRVVHRVLHVHQSCITAFVCQGARPSR